MTTDIIETSPLKSSTAFLLDAPKPLLKTVQESQSHNTESCADEIVRQLTQIVKNNETYAASESEKTDVSEAPKPLTEFRYDGDTSSQYSLELLNADFNTGLSQNHSKSHSFETDNTDMSLPKFHGEIPSNTQPEVPKFDEHKPEPRMFPRQEKFLRRDFSIPQDFINDESSKIYIIDASTPSPKSKRYVDSSLDSLEMYQQPIRKIVEAEIHQHGEPKAVSDLTEEEFSDRVKEVRDKRRPVITIDLQGACALPPDYYYQSQITKMAIKGVF